MTEDEALRSSYPSMFTNDPVVPGVTDVLKPTSPAMTEDQMYRQMYPSMFQDASPPVPPTAPAGPTAAAPSVPTNTAAAAPTQSAETAAVLANLATLGVTNPEGSALDGEAFVKLHDSFVVSQEKAKDAQTAAWEAQTRRELSPAKIELATAFGATLPADVRDFLTETGAGSHPFFVDIAAELQAARSGR